MERVKIFMFLEVHIIDNLKWPIHTDSVVKMQLHLFNLRKPQKLA